VTACLNAHYWNVVDDASHAYLSGGWGKSLWVRPPRDIDVLFVLPNEVYHRYQQRVGNRQSDLLQEVKRVLTATYSTTQMRGDGQVVVVPFGHVKIEVVPAFALPNGRFLICETSGDGSYHETDLMAERRALNLADSMFNGCARPLIRMAKQWQRYCNVDDLKSFMIERLVIEFLFTAREMHVRYQWWDWLLRDFFAYLGTRANGVITMPGTGKKIAIGDGWVSKAASAHGRAVRACELEKENEDLMAGSTWQMVFGTMIPVSDV